MEHIRNSKVLKIISYLLIPVLVLIIGRATFCQIYVEENREELDKRDYFKTDIFANQYYNYLVQKMQQAENSKESNVGILISEGDVSYLDRHYNLIEEGSQKIYYEKYNNYYYGEYDNAFSAVMEYLMLDKNTNTIYTNIKLENGDYKNKIQELEKHEIYWNMVNGTIQTSIAGMTENSLKYENGTEYVKTLKDKNIDIYTSINKERIQQGNTIYTQMEIYNKINEMKKKPTDILQVSILLFIMIVIYLIFAIGHEKGKEEIALTRMEDFPYEILFTIIMTIVGTFMALGIKLTAETGEFFSIMFLFCYFVCYASLAVLTVSTIKRIKVKKFWSSFLICKIFKWTKNKIKNIKQGFEIGTNDVKKAVIYYIGFILISMILMVSASTGISLILLLAFWIWAFYKIICHQKQMNDLKEALKNIYEGKNEIDINQEELHGILKEMATYINDIAGGFSNAIEESLKSERLKTELITNVSHDIKTPLTSIINYVDLLKKEDIQDEKIKEYIAILDQKSQRLKKLTEDLVEASKVSSGNVTLNVENIDIKELLNQTIGEFEDKFKAKGLKIEQEIPKEEIKIEADNRYMYRIIENLFSNITKYAMEQSRIYIKLENTGDQICLEIKNISKEKLNISAEELMQRFVRGDKSRYTEGSGLGLSIAQSLTELQGGTFVINIDGDLFKVEMIWDRV